MTALFRYFSQFVTFYFRDFPSWRCVSSLAFVLVAVAGPAACSDDAANDTAGQVAAQVNGKEVTLLQMNNALEKEQVIESESVDDRTWRVAQDVVQRELLVQQAEENQIHRRPEVMQAIEAAREGILARTYLEQLFAGVRPASDEQVKRYYTEHPELFAQRRIYHYAEVLLDKALALEKITERLGKAKSLENITLWADQQQADYATRESLKAAENIEPEILKVLHGLSPGQLGSLGSEDGTYVVHLFSRVERPITLEQATPAIQETLTNQAREHVLSEEMRRLVLAADIQWLGQFAALQAQQGRSAAAAAQASEEHISSGAAGLK